jgi:alpha-D-xyloside xylohydrolase
MLVAVGFAGKSQTWQKTNEGIGTTIDKMDVEIQFYTAATVRVIKSPAGSSFTKKSLSVIATPVKIKLLAKQQADVLIIKNESITVQCNLPSGAIHFFDKAGTVLLYEKENSTSFQPFNDAGNNTYTVEQAYELDKVVGTTKGGGEHWIDKPDKEIIYSGKKLTVRL